MGSLWGAVIVFVAHWSTRGRRDFTSLHGLSAERYDVVVAAESAAQAAQLLSTRHVN